MAEFCIYHLLPLEEGQEGIRRIGEGKKSANEKGLFPYKVVAFGKGEKSDVPRSVISITRKSTPAKGRQSFPSTLNYTTPQTLTDIAPVIRSKNSGPYEITLDVVFASPEVYSIIKSSSILAPSVISSLYNLSVDEIIWCGFFDQALGWKCTIPRIGIEVREGVEGDREGKVVRVASGSFMESDVHASQQYAGLLKLELGNDIKQKIAKLNLGEKKEKQKSVFTGFLKIWLWKLIQVRRRSGLKYGKELLKRLFTMALNGTLGYWLWIWAQKLLSKGVRL